MAINTLSISTPRYLLMGSDGPIGPAVIQPESNTRSSVVFGFSSKEKYDLFCATSQVALRPYPLLKGHLNNQTDSTGKQITLVCVDPVGSAEAGYQATTAESLVEALRTSSEQVTVDFHLIANNQGSAYQLRAIEP